MGEYLYWMLVNLLCFATGTAAVASYLLWHRKPRKWLSYLAVKLGVVATSGVLLWVVVPQRVRELPLDGPTLVFTGGLALTGFGLVGVCKHIAEREGRHRSEEEGAQDEEVA